MRPQWILTCWLSLSLTLSAQPNVKDIDVVARQGIGTAEGRAAWDRLAAGGPEALLPLLDAMPPADTAASNWLRSAFDRIVQRHSKETLPADALLAFAQDTKKPGRARRLALETVEAIRPGISVTLYTNWLEDSEFRYEAVQLQLDRAKKLSEGNKPGEAHRAYRTAWASFRDLQQGRDAAAGLKFFGEEVSVAHKMGFFLDWYVIGPFDAQGMKGFKLSYPPEKKVDLEEVLEGQNGKVKWVRFTAKETSSGKHQALINLRTPLGDGDDAVAFAYTEFEVDRSGIVEFRGAADDNFTIFVNGKREFGFEEYRNGVRLDRHRFKVPLVAGKNTVLVKVVQTPPPNSEPNWEFLLRMVDETGQGIPYRSALK
jgi:hypothetical protein